MKMTQLEESNQSTLDLQTPSLNSSLFLSLKSHLSQKRCTPKESDSWLQLGFLCLMVCVYGSDGVREVVYIGKRRVEGI